MLKYPAVRDSSLVGTYPALVKSGGGFFWDEVLEYRVWCHPEEGTPDTDDGSDYYYPFGSYEEALKFSQKTAGTEAPIALVMQQEYISEQYVHVKEQRLTEWAVEFLSRPKRTTNTITNFLSLDAPNNRLDIIRGLA
jgi:hypothetical protein